MSDITETRDRAKSPFKTVHFGGYERADVDAYLTEISRAAKMDRDEIAALKRQVEDLRSQLEAGLQDSELKSSQMMRDADEMRQQARVNRDDLERARIELAKANDELDQLREEKESYQRLAERLSSEEVQTRELLKAASRTAEELKAEAKREGEDTLRRAEESARHIEEDARRRVDELRKEYERVRREYDDFLKQARDVTDALVRRIEDARVKWPG